MSTRLFLPVRPRSARLEHSPEVLSFMVVGATLGQVGAICVDMEVLCFVVFASRNGCIIAELISMKNVALLLLFRPACRGHPPASCENAPQTITNQRVSINFVHIFSEVQLFIICYSGQSMNSGPDFAF